MAIIFAFHSFSTACILCIVGFTLSIGDVPSQNDVREFGSLDAVTLVQLPMPIGPTPTEIPTIDQDQLVQREILYMQNNIGSPEDMEHSCRLLTEHVERNHMFSMTYCFMNVQGTATKALKDFSNVASLQLACTRLLAAMASWNHDAALAVGTAGALDPVMEAVKKFGGKHPSLLVMAARIQDNSLENKYKMDALGGFQVVRDLANEYTTPRVEMAAQCFFATACGPHDITADLATSGYIPRAIRVMREFPGEKGIRGEVLTVISKCFIPKPKYHYSLMAEGIVEQTLATMKDEIANIAELDDADPVHLYTNAMNVLSSLAAENETWHDAIVTAGAIEEIGNALNKQSVSMTSTVDMDARSCPTAFSFGYAPSIVTPACKALVVLTRGRSQYIQRAANSGVAAVISQMLSTGVSKYDPQAETSCSLLTETLKMEN